ncbi:hypothetical protein M0R45_001571 [Rubus argutus]|uniref:Uncharacterized protein n=1 Tax=Rubus argutus TaxID=59490 RepID=A0AAW1VL65_RUBAR
MVLRAGGLERNRGIAGGAGPRAKARALVIKDMKLIWSEGEGCLSELGRMILEWCLGMAELGCADLCL